MSTKQMQSWNATKTNAPAVHDLQTLAQNAATSRPRKKKRAPSRAARLHLIDSLSRWGGSGLALAAGIGIYLTITVGRAYPLRAVVWIALVFAALNIARRLQREFRAGDKITAKPFKWQAAYTSALLVLSVTLGAGAFLLTPEGAPSDLIFQTVSLLMAALIGAAALHIAHGAAAVAVLTPGALMTIAAAWRASGMEVALFGVAALFIAASAALYIFSQSIAARASARFPWTTFLRRPLAAPAGKTMPGVFSTNTTPAAASGGS